MPRLPAGVFRPAFHPLLKKSVERADCIIVSHPSIVEYSEYLADYSAKCVVAPYGIDTDFWSSRPGEDEVPISELRKKHPRLIVACGRLVPYKGFDVLSESPKRVDVICSSPVPDRSRPSCVMWRLRLASQIA